jgi:Cu+-exporting ATPase
MHREISHADDAFAQPSNLSLYALTALLGILIGIDLWPWFAAWVGTFGVALPSWSREAFGSYRPALIAAVIGGARILFGSVESLLEGRLGADIALAIACIAAILIGEPLVAAEVVFIGMVGECLEAITFDRTQRAVRKIAEVCPRRCWLLRDGQEVRVLTSELKIGDRVVVKPGARVPVDGVVTDGRSAVDASALTGESLPVDKTTGDEVLAGSLNQFGALTIEARQVAQYTVVGRVIELTARALKDKAPIERTADRLARYFLPVVLALAALTFFVSLMAYWGPFANLMGLLGPFGSAGRRLDFLSAVRRSVYPALAVLVVSCPCALILATPAAIIAALGRLAGTGVLIKGGRALERLARVQAIAFDKTGTLTEGRLELGDLHPVEGVTADDLLGTAALAEQGSEHPLAQVLLQEVRRRQWTLPALAEFQAQPGAGVIARTSDGHTLLVGNPRLLEQNGVAMPPTALERLAQLDRTGQTALVVARDGVVLGVVGARDRVRAEAAAVIAELRGLGIADIALLTGDRAAAAMPVAAQVGIEDVHAGLLPDQKADFIAQWRGSEVLPDDAPKSVGQRTPGRAVAMVGDGINDAPALARADVGLAIGGTGTDVAAEAGDVVFMGDPLRALPLLVRLSRETVRIIWQNILIFAFGVNIVGVVITAWLWPIFAPVEWFEKAPLAGVIYHQFGSLAVLLNAMRLLGFERGPTSPTLVRWGGAYQRFDRWMQAHFNLDEGLHWIGHHIWGALLTIGTVLLLVWIWSGIVIVGPDEVAVVRRFGQPLPQDLGPGLHWGWPWPIDNVVRLQPGRVRTVEVGFRFDRAVGVADNAALGWSSGHRDEGIRRIADEAVMITGDGNLVELQATVQYTIAQPREYLFSASQPDEELRAATEAALRETVAARQFLDLLTIQRQSFEREVLSRLGKRLAANGQRGLGVHLDSLSLRDLHPPQEVVADYHEVARAMELRDQLVNNAQASATATRRQAESSALKVVREAQAAAKEKISGAEADRDGFLARLKVRNELSPAEEWKLLSAAAQAVGDGKEPAVVYAEYQKRRAEQLAVQRFLTDFRLTTDRLADALGKRVKVIVDADHLPGRRQLFMFDPTLFKPPPAVMMPRERPPLDRGE